MQNIKSVLTISQDNILKDLLLANLGIRCKHSSIIFNVSYGRV